MWSETMALLEEAEKLEAVHYDGRTLALIRDTIQEAGEMGRSEEAQALLRKIEESGMQIDDVEDEGPEEKDESDVDAMDDALFTASYLNRTTVALQSMVSV